MACDPGQFPVFGPGIAYRNPSSILGKWQRTRLGITILLYYNNTIILYNDITIS
jgi:hypothetical protein